MATISFRVNEQEARLIRDYTSVNDLQMSTFVRNLILDKIEEDLKLDEERVWKALKRMEKEEVYDHTEVWERLGV